MNVEKCVLCGHAFSINNKDRRVQRKSHFILNHADFLGSSWDGLDHYAQQEVSSLQVVIQADRLNSLLNLLMKDLKWSVIPACTVMKER